MTSTSQATCQDAEKVTGISGENEESSRSKDDKDVEYEFFSIIWLMMIFFCSLIKCFLSHMYDMILVTLVTP